MSSNIEFIFLNIIINYIDNLIVVFFFGDVTHVNRCKEISLIMNS